MPASPSREGGPVARLCAWASPLSSSSGLIDLLFGSPTEQVSLPQTCPVRVPSSRSGRDRVRSLGMLGIDRTGLDVFASGDHRTWADGAPMTSKADLPAVPPALQDVALIDAATCAAPGDMSVSWWYEKVAKGDAPAPVIRLPRCTRWSLASVRAFWIRFAEEAAGNTQAAERATARAKKASAAARAPSAVAKAQATRAARKAAAASTAGG